MLCHGFTPTYLSWTPCPGRTFHLHVPQSMPPAWIGLVQFCHVLDSLAASGR
ncbi:hypothetical protein HMPREF0308_1463 [Corynebacterium striatum ATCC 6940]|nr:hypothetical protein HMPREF0308_1463 [Corynebacterium striatum ATCC 6940]